MDSKLVPAQFRVAVVLVLAFIALQVRAQVLSLDTAKMPRIGTVDERFQSYNIEMVEVVGGRFWKPYGAKTARSNNVSRGQEAGSSPVGMDPNLYQYRPPIDLSNPRLRKLATALGPAYVRVSGTWANSVYFSDSNNPPAKAPAGFNGVLTQKEWKGVIDFAHAVNADIVTSVAMSAGTRNGNNVWSPEQARQLFAFTKSVGGRIAAMEFMNEPNLAVMGGAPKGYDAAAYARDVAVFAAWLKEASPGTLFLGPGSVAEGGMLPATLGPGMISSEDLLQATGPVFDVFSYHLYAATSRRCAKMSAASQTTADAALSEDWLSRSGKIAQFYANLRDRFEPAKSLWITETADAACGGNPWASTFLDTFRYLVEHAGLAHQGVKLIMHNTLAASDYGLLDQNTFAPRPDYWASLLWHKLMGKIVLDPQAPVAPNSYLYAQCLAGRPGGVALLVINADRHRSFDLNLPTAGDRYTLTARQLEDTTVALNGKPLRLRSNGDIGQFEGEAVKAGQVSFAPISITYLSIANAGNTNCQ